MDEFSGYKTRFNSKELRSKWRVPITGETGVGTGVFETGQETWSVNNGGPPARGTTGDIGGPFRTVKYEHESTGTSVDLFDGHPILEYKGPIFAYTDNLRHGDWPGLAPSGKSSINALGATAIARVEPTNPIASVSTFLGELRQDGLPDVVGAQTWKAGRPKPSVAGEEYLNYQFGIAPLVGDLRKFAYAAKHAHEVLDQYERNSGKPIHRSYSFPSESGTEFKNLGLRFPTLLGNPPGAAYCYSRGLRPLYQQTSWTRERWFKGAFMYYLNVGTDARSKFVRASQEANKLLGTDITVETLYNLTPYSWAADWFTSLGDVVHNVNAFEKNGLVMQYGYLMETTTTETTYFMPGVVLRNGIQLDLIQTFRTTWKTRTQASPYGFGIENDTLDGYRLAIIAALGLTKGSRRAR